MFIGCIRFISTEKHSQPGIERCSVAKRLSHSDGNIEQPVEQYISVNARQKIRSGKNTVALTDDGIGFDIEGWQGDQIVARK
jgi:hypothetical protein